MYTDRLIVLVGVLSVGLVLAGCDERPDKVVPLGTPVDAPADQRDDARDRVDEESERKQATESTPVGKTEKVRRPLDLSLPPQPPVSAGSSGSAGAVMEPILPDLFQQQQNADDGSSVRLKGEVFVDEEVEPGLDSPEGGQVIIELKTR